MIAAEAFPIYDDGRSGDSFAQGEGGTAREALFALQAHNAEGWRYVENDAEVVRISVEVAEVIA